HRRDPEELPPQLLHPRLVAPADGDLLDPEDLEWPVHDSLLNDDLDLPPRRCNAALWHNPIRSQSSAACTILPSALTPQEPAAMELPLGQTALIGMVHL